MKLTDGGEGRVRGYLFVLERSLRTFLPREIVSDAVREVESHLRERIDRDAGTPNEAAAVERILAELGTPLRVAQAYSAEITIDEAVTTGRVVAVTRALVQIAMSTISGFLASLAIFIGYSIGLGFIAIAMLKPIFPQNVGFVFQDGYLIGYGATFGLDPGVVIRGGYWIVPFSFTIGLLIVISVHRGARGFLRRWRAALATHASALTAAPRHLG